MNNREKIAKIIEERLTLNKGDVVFGENKNIVEDYNADNPEMVELVIALEEKFAIEIPDEEVDKTHGNVDLILKLVCRIANVKADDIYVPKK